MIKKSLNDVFILLYNILNPLSINLVYVIQILTAEDWKIVVDLTKIPLKKNLNKLTLTFPERRGTFQQIMKQFINLLKLIISSLERGEKVINI